MRLIDADKLSIDVYKRINKMVLENEKITAHQALIEAMSIIGGAPAITAVPVVLGEWISMRDNTECDPIFVCSNCKETWILNYGNPSENNMNYCPCCGAKMDLDRAISDKDVTDWLNCDLDELIDFDYKKDGDDDASK